MNHGNNSGKHLAIYTSLDTDCKQLSEDIISGKTSVFGNWSELKGLVFSDERVQYFVHEEQIHDNYLPSENAQPLSTMSSGEKKKAVLNHLLNQKSEYLILANTFDFLDKKSQDDLKKSINKLKDKVSIIQFFSRIEDILVFIKDVFYFQNNKWKLFEKTIFKTNFQEKNHFSTKQIPLKNISSNDIALKKTLVSIRNLNVSYQGRPVIKNINWTIQQGDFWQIKGENGSGKSTLLSIIIGDNPKAYGQDICLFGKPKNEWSVWDIKKQIGYFNPNIPRKFNSYQKVEDILLGGFFDSFGLYQVPNQEQKNLTKRWLDVLEMSDLKNFSYTDITLAQQRMLMIVRSLVKQPELLILDEPTSGLDFFGANLIIDLINNIFSQTQKAIVYVSHRDEQLGAKNIYQLSKTPFGSLGKVV